MRIVTDTSSTPHSPQAPESSGSTSGPLPKGAYPAVSLSVSLLNDLSLSVRRGAAAYLVAHANELTSLPPHLLERLVLESDHTVVRSIIDSLSHISCHAETVVPALLHSLADTRPGVAIAAARCLGMLGTSARSAFIPMQILSRTVGSEPRDPRVRAFEESISGQAQADYFESGAALVQTLSAGRKTLSTHLRQLLRANTVNPQSFETTPVVIGMCLGNEKLRNRALAIIAKHGREIADQNLGSAYIEGALAFIAPEIERGSAAKTMRTNFFYACCKTRPHSGLEYVVSRLTFGAEGTEGLELLRDYTGAYLSEGQVCGSTVGRMCAALWSADPATVKDAATNLGALTDFFPQALAQEVLDRMFETLVCRADERSQTIVSSLVTAISYITRYEQEIVDRCAAIIAARPAAHIHTAIGQVLNKTDFRVPEQKQRASLICKYLAVRGWAE